MPEVFLASGAQVTCSPEDYDLVTGASWRVWTLKGVPRAVREAMSKRMRFRLHLHREVAFRIHPDLVREPARMSVRPLNGNFLDVRRENLEIAVKPRARGGVRRPAGWKTGTFRGTRRPTKPAPAWSRGAAGQEAVLSD